MKYLTQILVSPASQLNSFKKLLLFILISFVSLTIVSCSAKETESNTTATLSAPSGLTAAGAASQVTLD